MKAIVKHSDGIGLHLVDVPMPKTSPGEILIKVSLAGICGSDMPIWNWDDPWVRSTVKPGQIIGHEFCGEVVDCGNSTNKFRIGELVAAEGHIHCKTCKHCNSGKAHLCPNQRLLGFDFPGIFAEYVKMPEENVVSVTNIPLIMTAILDPFGNAVHAISKVNIQNSVIFITGCGPLGLMTIALSKYFGAQQIFASDVSPYRLNLAKQMGANYALNPQKTNIEDFIKKKTRSNGIDIFFEMSGAKSAIQLGFKVLTNGGECVMMGLPKNEILFDFSNYVIAKGITIHGVVGREMFKTWLQSKKLLEFGSKLYSVVPIKNIITHQFSIEKFNKAFKLMNSSKCGKVLFLINQSLGDKIKHEITLF